ncbi:MAG TPA: exo-alpha-sialidase, partial [Candidatus Hydrogenedentes bacterium]|nr:exo-alpha-sialidase [Candidatus Hydrogenedentota bacterium]
PGTVRNTLALVSSPDLRHWETRCVVLYHKDTKAHGFQYVDWRFEGEDIIAVCRTAHDDGIGGARNNHDANFMTFHRVQNFRTLTRKDSVADVLDK